MLWVTWLILLLGVLHDDVTASTMNVNITVGNLTYPGLGLGNEKRVRLPVLCVSFPDKVHINISVSQAVPVPDIKMATSVGDAIQTELPCVKTYICQRNIDLMLQGVKTNEGEIRIVVNNYFRNTKELDIAVPLQFPGEGPSSDSSPVYMFATFGLALVALVLLSLIIAICVASKINKRNNSSTTTVGSDKAPLVSA